MSEEIEFGTKAAADEAREEWADYVCPVDDDRRTKTAAFVSDAPEGVLDMAEARALESKGERTRSVTANLSERERERISDLGGFDQRTTTMSWESAKGVFAREGLTDQFWDAIGSLTDHDDPAVGAEEHVARYQEGGGSGGARDHGAEGVQERRAAAEQARAAQGKQCDHAADHCRHGDPDACEFLRDACGYDEQTVEQMLSGDSPSDESSDEQGLSGEQKGALQRAWGGYKAAISQLDRLLSDIDEQKSAALQAFAAINRIRDQANQEPLEPERLHELLEETQDLSIKNHAEHR